MHDDLVTICVPSYNSEKTIAETLNSLLQQTYKNVEIYVVDNASTDRTIEMVKLFDKVKLHVNQENIGAEANFQQCMHIGNGKYRAIYHADDIYEPEMIEKSVKALGENYDIGAVLTCAKFINEDGKIIGRSKTLSQLGLPNKYFYQFDLLTVLKLVLRHYNFLICPSLMMCSKVTESIAAWRGEQFGTSADLDLWFRVAEKFGLGLINQTLMRYRQSINQGTYVINCLRTSRSDIFKVLDYWMNVSKVKKQLNNADWEWYKEQIRRDNLQCSARALIKGDKALSRQLLKKSCSIKSFYYGLQSKTGIKFLLLLLFMQVINLPGFNILLKPFLCKVLNK